MMGCDQNIDCDSNKKDCLTDTNNMKDSLNSDKNSDKLNSDELLKNSDEVNLEELYACSSDDDCIVGGCSGQLCTAKQTTESGEKDLLISTCEMKPEYVCYKITTCGCVDGVCDWNKNLDFTSCLEEKKSLDELSLDDSTNQIGGPQ